MICGRRILVIFGVLVISAFPSSCRAFMLPSSCVLAPGSGAATAIRPTPSASGLASDQLFQIRLGEIPRGSEFPSEWMQGRWRGGRKRRIARFSAGGWGAQPRGARSVESRWTTAGSDGGEPEGQDGKEDSTIGGDDESGGAGDAAMRSSLKQKLLLKVATLNRGFVANEADRADIEELVEMLELENPNPGACAGFATQSSPIAGKWQLLYTTALDVLSLQLNPAITIGQIFQQVDADGLGIQNIIELQPPFAAVANRFLGSSVATLTVKLETKPVTDTRIDLKFVRTEFKANSLFGRTLDLPSLGVDIPQSDRLREALDKGGARVKGSKEKAREFAQTVKGTKKKNAEDGKAVAADTVEGGDPETGDVDVDVETSSNGERDENKSSEDGDDEAAEETKAEPPSASPTPSPPSLRTPFFETTYVDDDMRVGRTGEGDLFISVRAQGE